VRKQKLPMEILNILKMIRLHIVVGGILAFSLGALLAIVQGGGFNLVKVAIFYVIVLLGDLSTHFSNDYFDVEVDKNFEQKKFFSGKTILTHYPDLRPQSRIISLSLLSVSLGLSVVMFLLQAAPIELVLIMVGANFIGWFYSAPPLRLISRGLGEIGLALAVGFAIPAIGYLSVRGQLDPLFLWFAFPFVMYGLMLSLSLEAPDREIDLKGGKRNIVVRKGETFVFMLVTMSAMSASLAFLFTAMLAPQGAVDFRFVSLFSIVPLTAGFVAFLRRFRKSEANRFSTLNVASLFIFNGMMVAYLLLLAF
jgi:1,4-dihydroxy-2-naphthoate octaprenyltransferase